MSKQTCRKSSAGSLLLWSDLTLGPLLQGQTKIVKHKKCLYLAYYWSQMFAMSFPLIGINELGVF